MARTVGDAGGEVTGGAEGTWVLVGGRCENNVQDMSKSTSNTRYLMDFMPLV